MEKGDTAFIFNVLGLNLVQTWAFGVNICCYCSLHFLYRYRVI